MILKAPFSFKKLSVISATVIVVGLIASILNDELVTTGGVAADDSEHPSSWKTCTTSTCLQAEDDGLMKFKEGAEGSNKILDDVSEVFKDMYGSGAKDAGRVLKKMKALGELGGSVFGAVGIAFSVINLFIGGPDPMESLLNSMKEEFQIVNRKLDDLKEQMEDVEDNIVNHIYLSDFKQYRATLDTCHDNLVTLQLSPSSEDAKEQLLNKCHYDSLSPDKFLNWMDDSIDSFLDRVAGKVEYQMDSFLSDMGVLTQSTTMATYYFTICSGLLQINEEALQVQINKNLSRNQKVLDKVMHYIEELPEKYIDIQLSKDIETVVEKTPAGKNQACADDLQGKITERMNGWQFHPKISAYCYNPINQWNYHAFHGDLERNEHHGFYPQFRVLDKFSIGVNWSDDDHYLDLDGIKDGLFLAAEQLPTVNDAAGILVVFNFLEVMLKKNYGLRLHNVAYVINALSPEYSGEYGFYHIYDVYNRVVTVQSKPGRKSGSFHRFSVSLGQSFPLRYEFSFTVTEA